MSWAMQPFLECMDKPQERTSRLVASLPGLTMEWELGRSPLTGELARGSAGRTPMEKYGCYTGGEKRTCGTLKARHGEAAATTR